MATARRRRRPLTTEEIVAAALAVAHAEGLEAVTMRRVANELGVGTMSLYHHVADKRELVLLMSDEIAAGMVIPGEVPEHWRDALRAIAYRTRDTMTRHPWMLDSLTERPGITYNWLKHIEQSAAAVENLDVEPELATSMVMATDDYTIGHVIRSLRARAPSFRRSHGIGAPPPPDMRALLETGDFPRVAAFIEAAGGALEPPPARFEQGLEWLFDGMEAAIAADQRQRKRPRSRA